MRISDWSSDVCSSDLPQTRAPWRRSGIRGGGIRGRGIRGGPAEPERRSGATESRMLSGAGLGTPRPARYPVPARRELRDGGNGRRGPRRRARSARDRKGVVVGQSGSGSVDLGGRGSIYKKKTQK